MEEIWKDIKGYEGAYQASNFGRLKSLPRKTWNGKCFFNKKELILKQSKGNHGYLVVTFTTNKRKRYLVHRIIAETFFGNSNKFVNHKNSDRTDNNISNLEYVTKAENNRYSMKTTKKKSSIYKGVFFNTQRKKYQARITFNYKNIHLGFYDKQEKAALAYNNKAKELFGKFALLNEVA